MNCDSENRKRRRAEFGALRGERSENLRALAIERSVGVGHLPQKSEMTGRENLSYPVPLPAHLIATTPERVK
jgi:hypothetical protein